MRNWKRDLNKFNERKKYLLSLTKKIERRLRSAPEGTLRICTASKSRIRKQYYHRREPSDHMGVYLPKHKHEIARRLAQKGYDQMLLKAMKQEIKAIDCFIDLMPKTISEDIYEILNENRKELVVPEFETDEMYIARWEAVEYEGKTISEDAPELFTDRGEQVRSKSEVIIANILNRYDIPYRYEYPVRLQGFGTVYPDFTILDVKDRKEIYWEHQGMMDDPEYADKAISKISHYIKNRIIPGDRLIVTSETRYHPLNVREIEALIETMVLRD